MDCARNECSQYAILCRLLAFFVPENDNDAIYIGHSLTIYRNDPANTLPFDDKVSQAVVLPPSSGAARQNLHVKAILVTAVTTHAAKNH